MLEPKYTVYCSAFPLNDEHMNPGSMASYKKPKKYSLGTWCVHFDRRYSLLGRMPPTTKRTQHLSGFHSRSPPDGPQWRGSVTYFDSTYSAVQQEAEVCYKRCSFYESHRLSSQQPKFWFKHICLSYSFPNYSF